MSPSPKKHKIAAEKRELATSIIEKGGTNADAMRAVKKRHGSGISARDVIMIRRGMKVIAGVTQPGPEAEIDWDKISADVAAKVAARSTPAPKAKETAMRRFVLDRSFDATGTSGIGIVAEGVQFSSGHVVIHWLSQLEAINVYGNATVLEQLHGHNGSTVIKWLDQ